VRTSPTTSTPDSTPPFRASADGTVSIRRGITKLTV
jgi:hypothetical protein